MNKTILAFTLILLSFSSFGDDPAGLTKYVFTQFKASPNAPFTEQRLTNHQVEYYRSIHAINVDGTVNPKPQAVKIEIRPIAPPVIQPNIGSPPPVTGQSPTPKGTVTARPTAGHPKLPANPTQDQVNLWHKDVLHMQQDISHIEKQVAQALDLSLSAYAVAELPQATEGRSGVSIGMASAGGKVGEAVGFSSNFGDEHEYTIKISVSHAGEENAAGFGASYQW
jgi:hypothetical protein